MIEWYYARDGQQTGPVAPEEIRRLLAEGRLSPDDLVWTRGMPEWKPAAELPAFSIAASEPEPAPPPLPSSSGNPYAVPADTWRREPVVVGELHEIPPGSEPLDIGVCFSRAWAVMRRNLGPVVAAGMVFLAVFLVINSLVGEVNIALGYQPVEWQPGQEISLQYLMQGSPVVQLAAKVIGTLLELGLVRIALELTAGRAATIGMLFGEGRNLLRALVASLLYGLMVGCGLVLLIVPGIYLAVRFGMFRYGIVERNLGIIESLRFSWRITQGNALNLFGLGVMGVLLVIAGVLALLVGLAFAMPFVALLNAVAYRWLILGRRSVEGLE